jgi:hypothetical protein
MRARESATTRPRAVAYGSAPLIQRHRPSTLRALRTDARAGAYDEGSTGSYRIEQISRMAAEQALSSSKEKNYERRVLPPWT